MKNKGYVYLITCICNGKNYIGQTRKFGNNKTIGIQGRWKQHVYNAKNFKDECPKLNKAIRKYGEQNFNVDKLISCSLNKTNYYEQYYIKLYNSSEAGYNCTLGGDYPNFSEQQRKSINEKISIKAKKRWSDKKYRKKICKKISKTNKIKMWEYETRNNMLCALKNKRKAKYLPSNIYERKINGVVTGYEVKIKIEGKLIRKWFSSKKFSIEHNLGKAKEYLESLKVRTI